MSGAKKKIPMRRFKEFINAGDWEQYKLADILSRRKENRRIDSAYPRLAFAAGQGVIPLSERRTNNRDQLISDEKNKKYLVTYYNDIVYNPANLKYGAIDRNKYGQGVISPIYVTFTSNICSGFIEHIVKSHEFKEKALSFEEGTVTKRQAVNPDNLLKIDVVITPNSKEQEKISKLFELIDRFITLHQYKLDKLQATKKALLQEMFPEEGQDKPKRRFKGFTDAWEQRKLGDIATITGGGTPSTSISEYWNGDIDWYSPVEIGENRYVSGSIRKITKLGLEKSSAKILPVGTVLFTSRAGIGNTAILQTEGCTNQGFQSITPNSKELDTYFLYTMTPKLKRYGEVTGAGSTFVEVSGKQMEQMNLMIPSLEEQEHVSQLFKVMDDAITLHQRKLDKLKNLKQAYLNEIFV